MADEGNDAPIPMSEGMKILYKDSVDNIIFLKRQQWTITNYTLLVYAGVVALSKAASPRETAFLTAVGVLGWLYSTFCMVHTQTALKKNRERLNYMYRRYFTDVEQRDLALPMEAPSFNDAPLFIYGLLGANLVAAAFALYLMWRITPPGAVV